MSARAALIACVALLGACPRPRTGGTALVAAVDADRNVQEACAVTAHACTRCHDLDRILVTRMDAPARWRQFVGRMRLMPSSGIDEADARAAVVCLVHRSFGRRGLDAVAAE